MHRVQKHAAMAGKAAPSRETQGKLLSTTQTALTYAHTFSSTKAKRQDLRDAYCAWRHDQGYVGFIHRGSTEWLEMMNAISLHYRLLRNTCSRDYRAQKKLLSLIKESEVM